MDVTDRGISAAVDAALCLLLVSASVLTVASISPAPEPAEPTASHAVQVLGATSVTVAYRHPDRPSERLARGSLAGLLADAAAMRAADAPGAGSFVRQVRNATRRALARFPGRVAVRVSWRAGPDAPVTGRLRTGPSPPRDADVRAARLEVPVGTPRPNETVSGRAVVVARAWSP